MSDRLRLRLSDIKRTIKDIQVLLEGKTVTDLGRDRFVQAAFERFLEIISEASRHIPKALKEKHPHIPWRQIADLGNHLRHAYHRIDPAILWDTSVKDLPPLQEAVEELLSGIARLDGEGV